MERVHGFVRGRVQGVSYRYFTQQNASKLGLTGWVRNRIDGRVELLAEGEKEKLDSLIAWLHKGSPSSRVDAVDVEWGEAAGEFEKFKIRSTS